MPRGCADSGVWDPATRNSTDYIDGIDGIVAAIMAIGRAMVAQEEPQPIYQMFWV